MQAARTLVLGDVHLTRDTPAAVTGDLARLFESARGQRIVVAGDFFDLASAAPRLPRRHALAEIIGAHPALRAELARFLDSGGQLMLLCGNHDAAIGDAACAAELGDSLGSSPAAAARLTTFPWFVREDGLHVEHGHCYDPDNAPAHPLIDGEASLGIHFSVGFIQPTSAHRFLQANDQEPLALLISAFRWYGRRAPYVIYRYFHAAFGALQKAGPYYRAHGETARGEERRARFAQDAGIPAHVVDAVLAARAAPTLQSWSATFARLYMDRVLATLALGAGAAMAATGPTWRGAALGSAGLGAMLLGLSWSHGHNRYRGTVVERLARAAARIAETSGAELVVLGHTHHEALGERYANTGSFSWPGRAPGRPYLEIVRGLRPRAERRYWR